MSSNVKLLPLPEEEWNVRYGYDSDVMQSYARANVEHHTEALRERVSRLDEVNLELGRQLVEHEDRAERLAEALGEAADALQVAGLPGNAKRFRSLLRDHEEGKRWT